MDKILYGACRLCVIYLLRIVQENSTHIFPVPLLAQVEVLSVHVTGVVVI